jgi:hypothetical protein
MLAVDRIVDVTELEVDVAADVGMRLYNSSRFPAPQYSKLFPGQRKLQSDCSVAFTLPAPKELPQ